MRQALTALNKTRAWRGLLPLGQGIRIHWGSAVARDVGTLEQRQYAVV
ncbi:MAG: class 3 adenylate cyclase, partial [bacterium]